MNKLASIAVVLLVLFGGALWFLAGGSLNEYIKKQIIQRGNQYTEQVVSVDNVDMKLGQGAGTISGLTIANPAMYQQKLAFSLAKINLDINLKSLIAEPIVIDAIVIDKAQAFVELSSSGQSNFTDIIDAIERNLPASTASTEAAPTDEDNTATADEPKIRVEKIIISGVALTLDLRQLGNKVHTATLADINLAAIGGDAGLPASEIGGEIIKQVLKAIAKQAKKQQKKKLAAKFTEKIKKGLSDLLNKL
jgi:uncharacterized protein involved in outer membrane biogenesis